MTTRRKHQRNLTSKQSRRLHHESLEKRELLAAEIGAIGDTNAPRLISVAANQGEQFDLLDNNLLSVSPTELTFRFDGGQQLDSSTFSALRFTAAGGDGSFDEGNERPVVPGFVGFEDEAGTRIVVARFAETLGDDQYLIEIAGFDDTNAGIVGLRNLDGDLFCPPDPIDADRPFQDIRFEVEIGPRVVAVVPQPVEVTGALRTQNREQIFVYFNEDPLSNPAAGPITTGASSLSVVNPQFYKLIYTHDTVENTDDASDVIVPTSVTYDPALNRAALTYSNDLSSLPPALANNGSGTYRLRIGSGEPLPVPPQVNSVVETGVDTFDFATALQITVDGTSNQQVAVGAPGGLPATFGQADGTQSVIVTGGEIRSTKDVIPQWPGAADAAGLRENRRDSQVVGRFDTNTGINVFEYNFADLYGINPQQNQLDNAITPAQARRAREVLDLYSDHLGVQFIETENRGLQIVTGDLRAIAVSADTGGGDTPYSAYRVNDVDPSKGVLVLDAGENWYDGYGLSPDNRPSWFVEAIRGVGSLLGIGDTFELPEGVGSGGSSPDEPNSLAFTLPAPNLPLEPGFLSQSDVTVGQALHRPESDDVDFYSFSVVEPGRLSAETFAQRLEGPDVGQTHLDSNLKLFRVVSAGQFELVAANDDFYSNDSFIGVDVVPGDYFIGVSSTGNDSYNGEVDGSGLGGRTQGNYQLRVTYKAQGALTITDTNGTELDGDADGQAGGDFNFWFRVARDTPTPAANEPRVIFVDKRGDDFLNNGSLASPYRTIQRAFQDARRDVVGHPGDIVRLLPNGGADGLISTVGDNIAYEIGRGGPGNAVLADGAEFEVPKGVTVMIDAGSIIKLRTAKISVGSESVDEDRSLASLQVLGTPRPTDLAGNPLLQNAGSVHFTSFDDPNVGFDNNPLPATPATGQWAGIEFRNDFDYSEGRAVWETEGIFLDYVAHAEMQWGGGNISVSQPVVSPITMFESRPTIIHNFIHNNADSAISADPNSFLETNFHAPIFQRVASFTSAYDRVGPEIFGNRLINNSFNGLFVRVRTPAAGELEPMTVSGRMDDRDIVHGLSQVLVLQGQPGGPLLLERRPDVLSVSLTPATGSLDTSTAYDYRLTFVTDEGSESLASLPSAMRIASTGGLRLSNLPTAPNEFAGRRLYRLNPSSGEYVFVTQLDRGTTSYTDNGVTRGGLLPGNGLADSVLLPRFDARLSIDPGLVVKLQGARIEAGFGADFIAEGLDGQEIIFTSRLDDTFGAGGTFDSNNDGGAGQPGAGSPNGGDWGGLVFRQGSSGSLDFTHVGYGGGSTAIEGAFTEFNALEILQADVRVANSVFRNNADGFVAANTRGGRGFNDAATIFVRNSQPVIVNNVIDGNDGAAISVNPNALNFMNVLDAGRSTGLIDIVDTDQDNQGPLIFGNELDNNSINGVRVRSEILTTESVWDDTDIVHVVDGEIHSMTHHHRGGLRLKSDPNQSLVVKFDAGGTLVGSGRPLDIADRIGGTLQVLGQGGFPVILTSIHDDTVGAGFTPDGAAQTNTDNVSVVPQPGDWNGVQLLSYVNDRNVAYVSESERAIRAANADNATADDAQVVGNLAAHEYGGDENVRLGFNIRGTLADPQDQDVYQFRATGGTQVFIDIDDSTFGLDTVVELIDVNDVVLARSDNSFAETTDPTLLTSTLPAGSVRSLYRLGQGNVESPNSLDAGLRVVLPGSSTVSNNDYYVRVRSANGETSGQYQLSIRLRETDEVAGSTIQLADIRYATDAITVSGSPLHSPLVGDLSESLQNQTLFTLPGGDTFVPETAQNRLNGSPGNADSLGNVLTSDRGSLVVTGAIGNITDIDQLVRMEDVDVYQVDLEVQQIAPDVFDSENRFVTTTFDIDYADGLGRANTSLSVFDRTGQLILHSRDSNITDDVGRPGLGTDPENLTGGSSGALDAYIGPVELPEGTYYVAVSSAVAIPTVLNQFFEPSPVDTNIRLMPINSIRRIADEAFDDFRALDLPADQNAPFIDPQGNYTADRSIVEPLFDADSVVKYSLDDMRLFVHGDTFIQGNNRSALFSFNPFTGVLERTIGPFGPRVDDIAIRDDGELYAISTAPQTGNSDSGNIGNYLNVSSATGAASSDGDDNIVFQRNNPAGTDLEVDPNAQLIVNAITFPLNDFAYPYDDFDGDGIFERFSNFNGGVNNTSAVNNGERFFVVGQRDSSGRGEVPSDLRRNLLYMYATNNGEATSFGSTNNNADRTFNGTVPYQTFQGPASDEFEFGVIDTGFVNNTGGDGGDITGIAYVPADTRFGTSDSSFGDILAVTDRGGVHLVDPQVTVPADPTSPGAGYNSVIPTNFLGVVPIDPQHAAQTFQTFPEFTGMTMGPRNIENQRFRQVMFAVTDDNWLYAMEIENNRVVPANVFYNGRAAIPLVSDFTTSGESSFSSLFIDPTGLAFSTLEASPWHEDFDRGNSPDHGTHVPEDRSRDRELGGGALYYGFEVDNNPNNNTIERADDSNLGTLAPGGSHGSIISRPFSLEGYSNNDKPTLYFTYFIEVEGDDDYFPFGANARLQNDSFRVFGAGDDGDWKLLATNNNFRDLQFDDEFDYYDESQIPVQEIFDDDNNWRQARVDISPLAGSENVRIRFDFSTAGAMRTQFDSFELVAIAGDRIDDHETFTLIDQTSTNPSSFENNSIVFENIVGKDIVLPPGSAISNFDQFSLVGPEGAFTATFVQTPSGLPNEIVYSPIDSVTDIAAAVFAVLPNSLSPRNEGGGRISLLAASDVIIGDSTVAQSNPVQINTTVTQLVVPDGSEIVEFEQITFDGPTTTTTIEFVQTTGAGNPAFTEVLYSPTNSASVIAQRIVAALPSELDAIVEIDGTISFLTQPVITIGGLLATTTVNRPFAINENRFAITMAAGDDLNDGETLVFDTATGPVTVTFVDTPFQQLPGNGIVAYQGGDSPFLLSQRLVRALPVEMSAFLDFTTRDVLVHALGVTGAIQGTSIIAHPITGLNITAPDGSMLIDGEIFRVNASGNPTITFINDIAPTIPGTGIINFQSTDTASDIAGRLFAELSTTQDGFLLGTQLTIYGASNASSDNPTNGFVVVPVATQEIIVPGGVNLNDGETLTLTVAGVDTIITFNDNPALPGPQEVNYQASDSAALIASKLLAALPPGFNALLSNNGTFDTVRLSADNAVAGTTNSLITFAPVAYTNLETLNLGIADGSQIVDGESVQIFAGGEFEGFTFIETGSGSTAQFGFFPVLYDATDTAADLIPQILQGLPLEMQGYADINGNGLIFSAPPQFAGFDPTAFLQAGNSGFLIQTDAIDVTSVPISLPDGSRINEFESITILAKSDPFATNQLTFTFVTLANQTGSANEVIYAVTDTSDQIASKLLAVLPLALQGYLVGTHEVHLVNGLAATTDPGSAIVAFATDTFNAIPVQLASSMSTPEVAARLQAGLAEGFGRLATVDGSNAATAENFKVYGGDRIRIFNSTIVNTGPFGSSYNVDADSPVPGDEFGEPRSFFSSDIQRNGALNNQVEGVIIDDIIIGFAERGEMVLNAPNDNFGFVFNPETLPDSHPQAVQPERQNETLVGGYTLEVRTSDEYGVPEDYDPINLELGEFAAQGRSFDTNDRLADNSVTLFAQSGQSLIDGDSFVLDDGTRLLTFEFDSILDGNVTPGAVAVPFDPSSADATLVARAMRDAINSDQAQDDLAILASTGDLREAGTSSGNLVELFGDAIAVNPGGGRFIKLDLVAEETFQGRETALSRPVVDHDAQTVSVEFNVDTNARAAVSGFADGSTDVLVGVGKIGDFVATGEIVDDDPRIIFLNPELDSDAVRIYLRSGETVDIDVDTAGFARGAEVLDLPVITVFNDSLGPDGSPIQEGQSSLHVASSAPGESNLGAFLTFTAPESSYYDVVVSSANLYGSTTLFVPSFGPGIPVSSFYDGTTFGITVAGIQEPFRFTTNPALINPDNLIILDPSDDGIAIATKTAAVIASVFPDTLTPTSENDIINLGDVDNVDLFVNVSATVNSGTSFLFPSFREADYGEYALTIRPEATASAAIPDRDVVTVDYQFGIGDKNRVRDQGQIVISSNFISDSSGYGIVATSGDRGQAIAGVGNSLALDDNPRPGSARLLRNENSDLLVSGPVIINNVIAKNQTGGILFAGGTANNGEAPAPVPFGRIVNNTLVGGVVSTSTPNGATFNGIFFPTGISSFVDAVVQITPGNPPATANIDPADALGPPDGVLVGAAQASLSLGEGGSAIFEFIDNALTPSGDSTPDLHIFEEGGNVETTAVEISEDGITFIPVGNADAQTTSIDIDQFGLTPGTAFRFVRLTDDVNQQFGPAAGRLGADIDAIGAISSIPPMVIGAGITVLNSASPTILNNILSNFGLGLDVDPSSEAVGTVVGGNAFNLNETDSTLSLSTSSIVIPPQVPLFADPSRGLYIPADGSKVIDSSFGSLPDRLDFFNTVKQPVGISPSPIIAPEFDAYGQARVDDPDVETPGVGINPNIDRGAIDRADDIRPVAVLTGPQDAIGIPVPGGDGDIDASFVRLSEGTVEFFEIQLLDESGTGPDAATINNNTVLLTENGQRLVAGVDYVFGYSDNSRTIRLTPLAGLWRPDAVYEITLNNQQRVSLDLSRGDQINDGDQIIISDTTGSQSVFEFESGFSVEVPQTFLLTVRGTNANFRDRDTFTIISPTGLSRTFEINTVGSTAGGNVAVQLTTAGTVQEVRQAILNALNSPQPGTGLSVAEFLDLVPVAVGSSQIQLGTLSGHVVAGTVNALDISGQAESVSDGQTFTYTSALTTETFEFTTTGLLPGNPNKPIPFSRSDTPAEVAESIAAVVAPTGLGLGNAQSIGGGGVLLGGADTDQLDLTLSSLQLLGSPGVSGSLSLEVPATATGASLDTTTFNIDVDGIVETFRYTTDPTLTSADRLILLDIGDAADAIAAATAIRISEAFPSNLSPTVVGPVITLGEQDAIPPLGVPGSVASVNVDTSGLILDGVSGGAIPVAFLPTSQFTSSATAATLQAAIRSTPLTVETFTPGGGTLLIAGAQSIVGSIVGGPTGNIGRLLPAVADLAGNPVRETRINDETRFTIIMPEVVFDLGDAPDSYGTTFARNGARHTVGGDRTPRLGQFLDTELDGQPSPLSDDTPVFVTVTGSGLYDIDTGAPNTVQVSVNSTTPVGGETLIVNVAGTPTTFELITSTSNPQTGNVPVAFTASDGPAEIAAKLVTAIRGRISATADALNISLDPSDASTFTIVSVDDEDGVSVGTFTASGTSFQVFTVPGTDPNSVTGSQVLGYINPLDPAGTNMAVTVTGAGLLDMWVDFDRSGTFELDEQTLTNAPVVDGVNTLTIFAPPNSTLGETWMRFRVSDAGNLGPTGVAVGGEVEDYRISVLPIALPIPINDTYSAVEDTDLEILVGNSQGVLLDNDLGIPSQILPVRYFVGVQPANGTVTVVDEFTGEFIYTPDQDFYGRDTFTYRLSTQQNTSPGAIAASTFATVTINVAPVNDTPGAQDQSFVGTEDTTIVITAAELLVGATGHNNPAIPVPPLDESNQVVRVVSVSAGGTTISGSNRNATATTIRGGSITATFAIDGTLTEVRYTPATDFNSDNLPLLGGLRLDEFDFTVEDDGVLLLPTGGQITGTREQQTARAQIQVTPQNDAPFLRSDTVSISNPDYVALGLPTPTEDEALLIPASFLLSNDLSGPSTAADENQFINGNDGALTIAGPVAMVDSTQGTISLLPSGDLLFTPTPDVYGGVFFTYSAFDQGVDEAIDGSRVSNVMLTTVTSTIFLEPVNDAPVGFDRSLVLDEIAEPGAPAVLPFSAADLITGGVGETPAAGGSFAATLPAPYDESEQVLRVVAFGTSAGTVDVNGLPGGTGTLTLPSDAGGLLQFNFVGGAFVDGTYAPPVDYNERLPFDTTDLFTFTIADDGATSFVNIPTVRDLPDERSLLTSTVTLTVNETNDPPVYQTRGTVDVLERDDSVPIQIPAFVFNQTPGPLTALDELAVQTLSFTVIDTTVPAGLMLQTPLIAADGTLTLFPAPDQFGTAVYTVRGTDSDPVDPRSTDAMFTVNVRPVNDAPRFDPAVAGTGDLRDDDEAYQVASFDTNSDGIIDDATITYTLREDNTQALGDPTIPYFLPLTAAPPVAGYARIGLLDVFNAGPGNEEAALPGGSQELELFDFPLTTALGGRLSSVFSAGVLVGLNYTPPVDFNNTIGGSDSFVYTIRDNSTTGGETWSLAAGALVPDRLTATNRVRFNLNPVNDRPEFNAATDSIEVPEDSQTVQFENFAFNINAAPPTTAFDEVDITTGQQVRFAVTAIGVPPSQASLFFSEFPTITPEGTLSFRPAPDVFGEFSFEIVLTDDGPGNVIRGDLISSLPATLTIDVQPINDPPAVDPSVPELQFTLLEDGTVDILVVGDSTVGGLLDPFTVGPANEGADILPEPGGNQSIRLGTPIPATTAEGGTLIPISDGTGLTRLRYQPRANFVGMDSFIYTVIDDGTTIDFGSGGVSRSDPRIASNTVTLEVLPVNDAPQFSGAANVTSNEDDGVVAITDWATNVEVGPPNAGDEIDGDGTLAPQSLEFLITQLSSNTDLFSTPPSAIVSDGAATLTYVSAADANGVATFEVRVRDNGPTDLSIGDDNLSDPQTFTIRVNAVNDPPSFTPGGPITVAEDSGPFNDVWATNVSPGPADELSQSVRFEVVTPVSAASLFISQPQISSGGVLRFTPAPNANGVANVEVTAIDSEDGTAQTVVLQIVITEVNDPPVPQDDSISTDEDTILVITSPELIANDNDPDLATNPAEVLTIVMPAQSFSVSGANVTFDAATGTITYDPTLATALQSLAPGESLTDSFSYSLRDTAGVVSTPVVVNLDVDGINDAPVLGADNPTLNPDGPTIIPALANDSDVDGTIDPLSIIITLQPAFGSLQIEPDGTLIYTPFGSFSEEDQFRYSVADNLGLRSDQALVTVSANTAPIALDDARGTFLDEAVDIDVAANDSDPDGQLNLASIVIVVDPVRGEAIPQANGTVRYLPEPGFIGNDSFKYTIADDEGRVSNVATVDTRVVASRLQNPDQFGDVNDDGKVSAIDALLIINHLSRAGNVTSIPVLATDRGPNFYDVSGNQSITALDALRVINELSRRDALSGVEGEFVGSADSGSTITAASFAAPDSAFALAPAIPRVEKVVDATVIESVTSDVIDLIAEDREEDQNEDSTLDALDAALNSFE